MKICYILEVNNIHSQRWINYFAGLDNEILVLSDSEPKICFPSNVKVVNPKMNLFTKIAAFKIYPKPYGNESFKWIPYRKEVQKFKPDIVHAMEALAYGFTLAMCGKFPKVLTPWGNDVFLDPFQSKIAGFLVKKGLEKADVISSNHPTLGNYLEKTFNISSTKADCFSWGLDLNIFNPFKKEEAEQLRKKLQIPENADIIISNRRFSEYWGGRYVIYSLPFILKENPNTYFIILRGSGESDFFREMKGYAEKTGISKNIRFIDERISEQNMAVFLNLASVFISAAFTDMLSISVLEGMACGAVPVVSDLESYRTRINDGENGYLIPIKNSEKIAEKIIHLLKNPLLRKKMSEQNWEIIRKNDDWKLCAPKMLSLYEKLIKTKK